MNTDISSKRSNLQRRRSLLRNRLPMKYNPYIGSFRHAPPSVSRRHFATSEWQAKERTMKSTVRIHALPSSHMKASPYIGWFRHAPSSRMRGNKRSYTALPADDGTSYHHIQKALKLLDCVNPAGKRGKLPQAYVSGRLPGGSPCNEEAPDADCDGDQSPPTQSFAPLAWLDQGVSESLQRSTVPPYEDENDDSISSSSTDVGPTTSATLGMLNKLVSLFLFPLVYDADSFGCMDLDDVELYGKVSGGLMSLMSPYLPTLFRRAFLLEDGAGSSEPPRQKPGETREESGVGEEEEDRRDDRAEAGGPNEDAPPDPWKVSVSSLAEAYHAHQASIEIAGEGNGMVIYPAQQEGERLDYVITQVDIARMARNASRHLDVESILGLPTVTYRSDQENSTEAEAGHHQKDEDAASVFQDELCHRLDDDEGLGGWSWMIVPPDPDGADDGADVERRAAPEPTEGTTDRRRQREFCVICLEHFRDGDRLRVLPCDHRFHMGCIDKWLSGTFSDEDCFTSGCPTCKKRPDVTSDGGGAREDRAAADGSVPSWAFARLGDALAKDTRTAEVFP